MDWFLFQHTKHEIHIICKKYVHPYKLKVLLINVKRTNGSKNSSQKLYKKLSIIK
jgi:hypothetical protein